MANSIGGRRLCGAVRFALTPPLEEITHCRCRSCRLSRGAAFVTWTSVPLERFALVEGEASLAWHRTSPGVRWGFCRDCGSSMLYVADQPGHPDEPKTGHVYVSLGSLTDPFDERAIAHVSWEEHVPWLEGAEALPRHRGKTEERM